MKTDLFLEGLSSPPFLKGSISRFDVESFCPHVFLDRFQIHWRLQTSWFLFESDGLFLRLICENTEKSGKGIEFA
jgi:hypothetical protein